MTRATSHSGSVATSFETSSAPATPPPEESQDFTQAQASPQPLQEARENPERPHHLTREESIREVVENHPETRQAQNGDLHKDHKGETITSAPAVVPAPTL